MTSSCSSFTVFHQTETFHNELNTKGTTFSFKVYFNFEKYVESTEKQAAHLIILGHLPSPT